MRTLILMRHAKSDWKQPGLSDHERPLNARGRRAAPLMGAKLRDEEIPIDVILASSARRVQETIELLPSVWGNNAEVLTEQSLYLAGPTQIIEHVQTLHDSWTSALVVGHNPGMAGLASHLSQRSLEMPTAAVARFECELESWSRAGSAAWRLIGYWKPRQLEVT